MVTIRATTYSRSRLYKGNLNIYFGWLFTARQNLFAPRFSGIFLQVIWRRLTSAPQKLIFFRLTAHEHDAYHLFLCWVDVLFKCMRVEAAPFKFIVRYCPQQNKERKKERREEKKEQKYEIRNNRTKVIIRKNSTNEMNFLERSWNVRT